MDGNNDGVYESVFPLVAPMDFWAGCTSSWTPVSIGGSAAREVDIQLQNIVPSLFFDVETAAKIFVRIVRQPSTTQGFQGPFKYRLRYETDLKYVLHSENKPASSSRQNEVRVRTSTDWAPFSNCDEPVAQFQVGASRSGGGWDPLLNYPPQGQGLYELSYETCEGYSASYDQVLFEQSGSPASKDQWNVEYGKRKAIGVISNRMWWDIWDMEGFLNADYGTQQLTSTKLVNGPGVFGWDLVEPDGDLEGYTLYVNLAHSAPMYCAAPHGSPDPAFCKGTTNAIPVFCCANKCKVAENDPNAPTTWKCPTN